MSKRAITCTALLCLLAAPGAWAVPFSGLVVFGDSLSDDGNASIALGGTTTPTPVSGNAFIPSAPYARPAPLLPAFTNGPTWVEGLAAALGLPLGPSLAGGNDFAFGGARLAGTGATPPSVRDQVSGFLGAIDITPGPDAPADALYVVWGGGNDARDAAAAVAASGNPADAVPFVTGYATDLAAVLAALAAEGAHTVLVPNVPDIGLTPAVQALGAAAAAGATAIAQSFNAQHDAVLAAAAGLGLDIISLDVFALLDGIVANPAAFGLTDVANACAASAACIASPDTHLFWDGIHPTAAGHAILARAALAAVPEPATWLLLAAALIVVVVNGCGRRSTTGRHHPPGLWG